MATPKSKIISLDRSKFVQWNEQMSKTYDIQDFLDNSFFFIRYVEKKRTRILLRFLGCRTTDSVIEVGCGQGIILKQVRSKSRFGIDLSISNVKKARRLFKNEILNLIVANVEMIPVDDHSFDRIICSDVIEHVQNPEKLLKEIIRILKQNGKIVITVPNDNLVDLCKKAVGFIKLDKLLGIEYGGGDEWHLHTFDMKQLKLIFNEKGLKVEKIGYSPCKSFPLRWIFLLSKES